MPLPLQARVIPYRVQVLLLWEEPVSLRQDPTELFLADSATLHQETTRLFLGKRGIMLKVTSLLFLAGWSTLLQE